jgi:hypothetical protein
VLWKMHVCSGAQLFQVDGVTHSTHGPPIGWIWRLLLIATQNCQLVIHNGRGTFVPTFVLTFQILYLPIDQ